MRKGKSLVKQVNTRNKIISDYDTILSLRDFYKLVQCYDFESLTKQKDLCETVDGFYEGVPFSIVFKNIYYLGTPHPDTKKRIEIPNNFKELYDRNAKNSVYTFLMGVYTYKNRFVYCDFDIESYYNNKLNNSAAHVSVSDLLKCFVDGTYTKTDAKGNIITFIPQNKIIDYLKTSINNRKKNNDRFCRSMIILSDARKEFQKWGATQISRTGELFESKVVSNYATALNTVFNDDPRRLGPIEGFDYSSVFECRDRNQFIKLRETIENHPRFNEANENCHRDLAAGLALYEKFLEYGLSSDYDQVFLETHYIESSEKDLAHAKKLSTEELKRRVLLKKSKKKTYIKVVSKQIKRDQEVVLFALNRAQGICDLCGKEAPFHKKDGEPYLECHHVKWLSKGGTDTIDNVVALCPNCHRECHVVNSKTLIKKLNEKLQKYKKQGQA